MATFPRFRDLEREHGSLIRGMLASRRRAEAPATQRPSGVPASMFVSLRNGTQTLTDTLADRVSGMIELNTAVTALRQTPAGYQLTLSSGATVNAQNVVMAIPAFAAAKLLVEIAPQATTLLDSIRYVSTATLTLAYRSKDIPRPLDGFGVVIPTSEQRPINAVTWTTTKFAHRAPDGNQLLRVFFGGSRRPEMVDMPDAQLLEIARSEFAALFDIHATPLFHQLFRWHRSTPQYDVGHLERVSAIEAALPPGLYVTGSPYRGIGIPDCVHQAQQCAQAIGQQLAGQLQAASMNLSS
jgi:protoporphyrinogen/coproporphyrinogen III oxidase